MKKTDNGFSNARQGNRQPYYYSGGLFAQNYPSYDMMMPMQYPMQTAPHFYNPMQNPMLSNGIMPNGIYTGPPSKGCSGNSACASACLKVSLIRI